MSWATVAEEEKTSNEAHCLILEQVESEEAVLHGLRSAYNNAIHNIGIGEVDSSQWGKAMQQLEKVSLDCIMNIKNIPSARNQLQEISYLAKRNRVQCLSKQKISDARVCYELALETVTLMIELGKEDMTLVLLAARYAKLVDDLWTYKQLILYHQHQLPYMYRDLVMAEFAATLNQKESDVVNVMPDVSLFQVLPPGRAHTDLTSTSELKPQAVDAFVSFLARKLLIGVELTPHGAFCGFCSDWVKAIDETSDQSSASSPMVTVSSAENLVDLGLDVAPPPATPPPPPLQTATEAFVAEDDVALRTQASVEGPALLSDAPDDGTKASRRSGRAAKKTDPALADDSKALQTAIDASKSMSRATSQSQLSRGSGCEDASNISEIKKLLGKAEEIRGWDAPLQEDTKGLNSLLYAFALPVTILDAKVQHTRSHRLHALESDSSFDPTQTEESSEGSAVYDLERVAALFSAYLCLVNGQGCAQDLINLFVKFIQAAAHPSGATSFTVFSELDQAVLICWSALSAAYQDSTGALLARLDPSEELLLLECALSFSQRNRASPVAVSASGQQLYSKAQELVRYLIPRCLGGQPDAGSTAAAASARVAFWLRYQDRSHQLRVLWAAISASRLFESDELSSGSDATSLELLTTLLREFADEDEERRIFLPHIYDEKSQLICKRVCADLLGSIQYEAEVRDLVRSYADSKEWVQGVLGQIRQGERLQSLLGLQHHHRRTEEASEQEESAPPSIPLLLLEACRKLKDVALWAEVAETLLAAAASTVTSAEGMVSGPWMADLLRSLLSHKPLASQRTASVAQARNITAISHNLALLLYLNGTGAQSADSRSIVIDCLRMYEEIAALDGSKDTHIYFVHAFVHVLCHLTREAVAQPSTPTAGTASVLASLWRQLDTFVTSTVIPSAKILPVWDFLLRLTVDVWELFERSMSREFRQTLLYVLLRLVVDADVSVGCKGQVYVQCHFEILDNSLHITGESEPKKRKRKRVSNTVETGTQSDSKAAAQNPIVALLSGALEGLVFDPAFESNFVQRVQREIVFVLGQVYFYSFGFPMVPLESDSDDEDSVASPVSNALNRHGAALLEKLYLFSKVCIRGGWINKTEIRSALLFLSCADVFKDCFAKPTVVAILKHLFSTSDAPQVESVDLVAVLTTLQTEFATDEIDVESDVAKVRAIGAELFFTLLQLGLPPCEVGDDDADADSEEVTSLAAECDLGLFLKDSNQGVVVELSMMDIAYNPFRYSSWRLLLGQYLEAFNAITDELQKLALPDRIPSGSYAAALPEYVHLLRPPAQDGTDLCVWSPFSTVPSAECANLFKAAAAGLQTACGDSLEGIFSSSLAIETFWNLHRTAESVDCGVHLQKLAHLIAIRNASFTIFTKMSRFVDSALAQGLMEIGSGDDERSSFHCQTEARVLLFNNAAKCYPKGTADRLKFKKLTLPLLQQDDFLDDDIYALATCAKLEWQLARSASAKIDSHRRLTALSICLRAVRVLKGDSAKGFSKQVRLSVLYQVSSLAFKASMLLLADLAASESHLGMERFLLELIAVEDCLAALLPSPNATASTSAAPAQSEQTSNDGQECTAAEEEKDAMEEVVPVKSRVWAVVLRALTGLRECRRLDPFDFKSVSRVASAISQLAALSLSKPHLIPAEAAVALCQLLGVRDLSCESALEELAKLFDRKRSQIVAMWCVENAVSPWEKSLVRISQFDTLRGKLIDQYLQLAVECDHLEVVLDVLASALAALKHATAVVVHTLLQAITSLRAVVLNLLEPSPSPTTIVDNNESDVEMSSLPADPRADKRAALRSDATRWLHIVFELQHQVRAIVAPSAMSMLEEVMLALYPYSSIYVQPVLPPAQTPAAADCSLESKSSSSMDVAPPEADNLLTVGVVNIDVHMTMEERAGAESLVHSLKDTAAAAASTAVGELLALCANKWGRPKAPRSDLGKRNKGYFSVRAAAITATTATSALEAEHNQPLAVDEELTEERDADADSALLSVKQVATDLTTDDDNIVSSTNGYPEEALNAAKVARLN